MSAIRQARALRQTSTWAEKLVWRWLRNRRFSSYKFRRQHPLGPFVLDFFCQEARLSIELDGSQHGHPKHQALDVERRNYLHSLGIHELRFWNSRLRRDAESIRNAIFRALQQRAPHPLPEYTRSHPIGDQIDHIIVRPHPNSLPQGEGTSRHAS